MKINRFVVHELIKEKTTSTNDLEPQLKLSEQLGVNDAAAILLIEEIHKSYGMSSSLKHTIFKDRNDKVFKNSLEKYIAEMNDPVFLKFSSDSLKELKTEISKEPFATGGYYIFSDYTIESKQFISVVLLRKRPGLNFLFRNKAFTVSETENLNIDRIAMGFRLNYNIYNDTGDERSYISLIASSKDTLSGYFKEWVVVADVISDEKNTTELLSIIRTIPLPKDETGDERYTRDSFKKACFEFVELNPKKEVNLKILSEFLYGEDNENNIINYARDNEIQIDNEFKRSSTKWKKLITIKAKVEGIELTVDYERLNSNEVDVNEIDNYIVIRSKELVKQIKAQKDGSAKS